MPADPLPPHAPPYEQPAVTATTRAYPGAAPCNTTLQACISASFDGDTITVAANTYLTASLSITHGGSLVGAGAAPSQVKLRPTSGRMIQYSGVPLTATFVLSNVMIENGAVGVGNSGGGVRVLTGSAVPLFVSVVISNNVGDGGGGIRVVPNLPVTMTNVVIFSNTSTSNGGGVSIAGSLALINSRIEFNRAISRGGGIDVTGALTILGGSVTTNTAGTEDGGGVRVGGTALISATRFVTNTAGTNGGAISAAQPITLIRVVIDRNAAAAGGGVFVAAGMTVTLQGGGSTADRIVMTNNTANAGDGGALHAEGRVKVFASANFANNKAPGGAGGAFYIGDLVDDFPNSTFALWANNTAGGDGGAIAALGAVNMWPSHPTFTGNSAGGGTLSDGGAIYASGSIFLCNGDVPSSGNSARFGGAFYSDNSSIFLNVHDVGVNTAQSGGCAYAWTSVTFNSANAIGCSATSNGGAAAAPLVILQGNGVAEFRNNTSGVAGGVARGVVVIVRDTRLISNTALSGGAISASDAIHISNAGLLSNTARTAGGAASVATLIVITDSVFANNVVTATGGMGGAVSVSGSAFISGTRFERNRAPGSGSLGGAIRSAGSAVITGGLFLSNTAVSGQGGAYADGPITVTSSAFEGNLAQNGGGISTTLALILGSVFTANEATDKSGGGLLAVRAVVRDSRFISNVYSGFSNADTVGGGGIFAQFPTVERSYFEGNISEEEGAAIYISRTGTISQSTFIRNRDTFYAGSAVFVKGQGNGATTVVNSVFDGNMDRNSSNGGGALDSRASTLVIEDSDFQNNRGQSGGAIRANSLTLRRSSFTNNVADCCGGGGAIYMFGSADIQSSVFISNYADCCDGGGAVYAEGFLSVADSQFISNSVEERMDGGAILAASYLFVDGSQFRSNRVVKAASNNSGRGGAIACVVRCEIETSRFATNLADKPDGLTFTNIGTGGAVWASGDLTVKRSRFIRNRAGIAGGALYLNRQNPFHVEDLAVQNSLFSANLASNAVLGSRGNALFVTGTINGGKIVFNTIVSETLAPGSAMAILSGTVSVIDNIITRQGIGLEHEPRGTLFENFNLNSGNTLNLSGTISSGGGSFTGTPVFLNPALDLYYLLPGSPGIDAGFDVLVTEDVDGQIRPQGAGFDIGFDEGGPRTTLLPVVLR